MLKIVRVDTLDGDMMDVELSNGNIIILDLQLLMEKPTFDSLREDKRYSYPKTDGSCVYWRDGPRLSLEEIFAVMKTNGDGKPNEKEDGD